MEKNYIDLFELQTRLKEGIECVFPEKVWLRAEISAVKARPGGHCYLELVQSGESGLVARAQAAIWSSKYRFLGKEYPMGDAVLDDAGFKRLQALAASVMPASPVSAS